MAKTIKASDLTSGMYLVLGVCNSTYRIVAVRYTSAYINVAVELSDNRTVYFHTDARVEIA